MLGLGAYLAVAASGSTPIDCASIQGIESLSSQRNLRWVIAGEQHGTNESPAIFGDVVCGLANTRKVVVAVELDATAQPEIDRFMASDGGESAQSAFLRSTVWITQMKDGRSSEAMFALMQRLRQMGKAGLIQRVVAFVPTNRQAPDKYEEEMARTLIKAAKPNVTVVALVGNIHALRTHWASNGVPYMPMAGLLPGDSTATFNIIPDGGNQWACFKLDQCGPSSLGPTRNLGERRMVFGRSPDRSYSGVIFTGGPATASMPKVPN